MEVPIHYRVVASVTNPPPPEIESEYLVVDLSGWDSASSYPISYITNFPTADWEVYEDARLSHLVLRRIPAGTFVMGSPTNEVGRGHGDLEAQVTVTLTQDYYIGVFEVTQAQWVRVMGFPPGYGGQSGSAFPNNGWMRPMERVSYNEIRERGFSGPISPNWPQSNQVGTNSFMGRLRARTGLDFDLPTQAQWEYACRAGTTTALNSGHDLTNSWQDARMAEVGRYWYNGGAEGLEHLESEGTANDGDESVGTAIVGSYAPNAWSLFDMHGNVWEWCLDWNWYGAGYPDTDTLIDPVGPASGSFRVVRGGSWYHNADGCRSAHRSGSQPQDFSEFNIGFRVAVPAQ